jgi:hypothetical protein
MPRYALTDLANLSNENTAVSALNANNTTIEGGFDDMLSRVTDTDNAMEVDLDMNSNRILNLPAAVEPTEPVRKAEFDASVGGVSVDLAALEAAVDAAELAETQAEAHALDAANYSTLAEGFAADAAYWAGQAGSITVADDSITNAKIRDSAGLSVIGRSANSSGDPADITGTDGQILRVSGTTLGFGQGQASAIDFTQSGTGANAITLASMLTSKVYTPEMFGAVGDGSTNDATPLQECLTAAAAAAATGLAVVVLFQKRYATSSALTLTGWSPGRIHLQGTRGSGLIAIGSSSFTVLTVTGGALGTVYTNLSNKAVWDYQSTVSVSDGANFTVDTYALVQAPFNYFNSGLGVYYDRRMLNKCIASSSGTLSWERPLPFVQTTSITAQTITKMTLVAGFSADSLTFVGTSNTGTSTKGFAMWNLEAPVVTNIKTMDFDGSSGGRGIYWTYIYEGRFDNFHDDNSGDVSGSVFGIHGEYSTGMNITNVSIRNSPGFGIGFTAHFLSNISNIHSTHNDARGLKFFGSCGNNISNCVVMLNGYTGMSLDGGSSYNNISNVIVAYNNWVSSGSPGFWMSGTENINNTITNLKAYRNGEGVNRLDVSALASGSTIDSGNVFIGLNPDAVWHSSGSSSQVESRPSRKSYVKAHNISSQTLGTTETTVTWTELTDMNGEFASNTYTVNHPGWYQVKARLTFTSDITGLSYIYIRINDAGTIYKPFTGGDTMTIDEHLYLWKGDTVKIRTIQNASRTLVNTSYVNQVEIIGP